MAVQPPPEAVAHLTARVAGLRLAAAAAAGTNVRLADPANAHVTLAFLGEVSDDRLGEVHTGLRLAAQGSHAGRHTPSHLRLAGGGRFGRGRCTVLWVGLDGDVEGLRVLARSIRSRLRHARLPHDEKPFHPHLTVARPGDRLPPADVEADLAALDDYRGPQWPASELVLIHSQPGPRPTYDRLATWPL
ncbi:2'-5' RNA ligase [Micromonospora nigra]|uniref:RNA 2',3'-cyclic phosphodiesterase n=1 Tax=Micromonospora nigra TaxID=145857 RepID=A0A1C6S654_9ACTN|nr:2'-5' RNA ligase [Micromonospora nigra]